MITKTLNLDSAYQDLFDEVREKSNGEINVNNLEAFFGSIVEIGKLDPKFLRLPLDEPMFEIDANSRKITVPSEFRSNGVSVQNDHLAELIFFKIDRYFDEMDLSNCDININWKMGNKTGKTSRFIKAKDIEPGYVIFGWPIDNEVTEKSGSLTFAVEFNRYDEQSGEVIYSFNTLPVSINIKEGLIIDAVEPKSLDEAMINMLVNSEFSENDAPVGDVTWLTGDGDGLVAVGSDVFQPIINLNTSIENGVPSSVPMALYAEGFVDEGTEVKYFPEDFMAIPHVFSEVEDRENLEEGRVYYTDAYGINEATEDDLTEAETLWTADALVSSSVLYVESSDPAAAYVEATEAQIAAWGMEDEVQLFKKVGYVVANAAGTYGVKAQGVKYDSNKRKIGNGNTISTKTVTVPKPEVPAGVELVLNSPDIAQEGYTFENADSTVFLKEGENSSIAASAQLEQFGALQFTWQKKGAEDSAFANVSEEAIPFQDVNNSILPVTASGEYKVSVVHFQNGEEAEPVESKVVIASPLAGKIVNAKVMRKIGSQPAQEVDGSVIQYNSSILSAGTVTLSIVVDEESGIEGPKGTLEYQWFEQVFDEAMNSSWRLIENATNADFIVEGGDGMFKPVVKNNLNGSIYTLELPSVSVDDRA